MQSKARVSSIYFEFHFVFCLFFSVGGFLSYRFREKKRCFVFSAFSMTAECEHRQG